MAKTALNTKEEEELASKKHVFTLVLSADYNWGSSAQPGSTYYLQKVSHDVYGLVDHKMDSSISHYSMNE